VSAQKILILLATLGVSPGHAMAQRVDLSERVDGATLAAVQPVLDAAERDSLPLRALESKVLEGAAKGRPPGVIARVVDQLAGDLRNTRAELRAALPAEPIDGDEIVAVAMARRQGVPMEAVVHLWQARPGTARLGIPVTVLAELVARGVPADAASQVMSHVLSSGVPLDRAAQIPGKLDGALGPGVGPPAALAEALRVLNIPQPPRGRGRGPRGG
jgi:hypothetical protein